VITWTVVSGRELDEGYDFSGADLPDACSGPGHDDGAELGPRRQTWFASERGRSGAVGGSGRRETARRSMAAGPSRLSALLRERGATASE
jgi:hypothetical protein